MEYGSWLLVPSLARQSSCKRATRQMVAVESKLGIMSVQRRVIAGESNLCTCVNLARTDVRSHLTAGEPLLSCHLLRSGPSERVFMHNFSRYGWCGKWVTLPKHMGRMLTVLFTVGVNIGKPLARLRGLHLKRA